MHVVCLITTLAIFIPIQNVCVPIFDMVFIIPSIDLCAFFKKISNQNHVSCYYYEIVSELFFFNFIIQDT